MRNLGGGNHSEALASKVKEEVSFLDGLAACVCVTGDGGLLLAGTQDWIAWTDTCRISSSGTLARKMPADNSENPIR
jgi:hypothetical protein